MTNNIDTAKVPIHTLVQECILYNAKVENYLFSPMETHLILQFVIPLPNELWGKL